MLVGRSNPQFEGTYTFHIYYKGEYSLTYEGVTDYHMDDKRFMVYYEETGFIGYFPLDKGWSCIMTKQEGQNDE